MKYFQNDIKSLNDIHNFNNHNILSKSYGFDFNFDCMSVPQYVRYLHIFKLEDIDGLEYYFSTFQSKEYIRCRMYKGFLGKSDIGKTFLLECINDIDVGMIVLKKIYNVSDKQLLNYPEWAR